jgi:hypothetical protein
VGTGPGATYQLRGGFKNAAGQTSKMSIDSSGGNFAPVVQRPDSGGIVPSSQTLFEQKA